MPTFTCVCAKPLVTFWSLAPVFTPLLGSLDEASKAVMLKRLGPHIPADREAQRKFFQIDASSLTDKEAEDYKRRSSNLKRTLVDHGGMSPIGLLRECLEFAKQAQASSAQIFDCVRASFATDTGATFELVSRINSFRNTYVAHQKKELTDVALARAALREWADGLSRLWALHRLGS